tara:strand:- start:418 stop:597 length:180 start_codon:yes stop_codon:yes gene_type:complete
VLIPAINGLGIVVIAPTNGCEGVGHSKSVIIGSAHCENPKYAVKQNIKSKVFFIIIYFN